ncbi:MAG: FTR1 family protein [Candidatus Thorarchaeota archaeon]|nr:FTR1 family protein [Candidatus Thorarchaeota archaeon]
MIITPTIISLREGIEVALILVIMLSYLKRTNQPDLRRFVLVGSVLAVAVSFGIAIVLGFFWGIFEGTMLNIFEGIVVIIAALLLTTMILWMWRVGHSIASDIEQSMESNVIKQSSVGLALLSFSLVLREGVELSLFSIALIIQEGVLSYLGVILGLTLATVLGFGIYKGSFRISMKSLFRWTSVFLILFAAGMIAYGIHELQEASLLLIGPLEIWNINPPVLPDGSFPLLHENGAIGALAKTLFGFNGNPSALEVFAYAGYITLSVLYYLKHREKMSPIK